MWRLNRCCRETRCMEGRRGHCDASDNVFTKSPRWRLDSSLRLHCRSLLYPFQCCQHQDSALQIELLRGNLRTTWQRRDSRSWLTMQCLIINVKKPNKCSPDLVQFRPRQRHSRNFTYNKRERSQPAFWLATSAAIVVRRLFVFIQSFINSPVLRRVSALSPISLLLFLSNSKHSVFSSSISSQVPGVFWNQPLFSPRIGTWH